MVISIQPRNSLAQFKRQSYRRGKKSVHVLPCDPACALLYTGSDQPICWATSARSVPEQGGLPPKVASASQIGTLLLLSTRHANATLSCIHRITRRSELPRAISQQNGHNGYDGHP